MNDLPMVPAGPDNVIAPDSLTGLQADIARQILALIRERRWVPGEKISYAALARDLNVSRTPVREVLHFLVRQGHMMNDQPRGFRLADVPPGPEDEALPASAQAELYDRLLTGRAAGEIGVDVSEAELVEQLGVTRGAVRRALMRLSSEGLAERRAGHGWRFAEALDDAQVLKESYAFRAIIECGALMDEDFRPDLAELRDLVAQQTGLLDRQPTGLSGREWFEANARFHRTLVSWSHNRFLIQSIDRQNSLRRMSEYAEFPRLGEDSLRRSANDHLAILEAIDTGDRAFAVAVLQRHLGRNRRNDRAAQRD